MWIEWGHVHLSLCRVCAQEGTLEDRIATASQRQAPIPEHVVLSMFLSACEGLHALHCCQDPGPLAHRDVKVCLGGGGGGNRGGSQWVCDVGALPVQPGNLLVKEGSRELVLMDLGSVAAARTTVSSRWGNTTACQWG